VSKERLAFSYKGTGKRKAQKLKRRVVKSVSRCRQHFCDAGDDDDDDDDENDDGDYGNDDY